MIRFPVDLSIISTCMQTDTAHGCQRESRSCSSDYVKKIPDFFETHRPKISKDLVPGSAKDRKLVEKKQRQIVEGACHLFFEKGFHGTNIREIAAECGMSMGQSFFPICTEKRGRA